MKQAIEYCCDNSIVLLSLPPHSSHKTQPLDRVFYGPLKTKYGEKVAEWISTPPIEEYTLKKVAGRFADAYSLVANVQKAINGFKCTGIYLLNPDVFDDTDFAPSSVTNCKWLSAPKLTILIRLCRTTTFFEITSVQSQSQKREQECCSGIRFRT
jgi:hypothetical protein